jgi:hypothetical protein
MQLHTEKCQQLVNAAMDRLHKGGRGYHKAVDASDAECASCPATIMEEALELLDRLDDYIDQTCGAMADMRSEIDNRMQNEIALTSQRLAVALGMTRDLVLRCVECGGEPIPDLKADEPKCAACHWQCTSCGEALDEGERVGGYEGKCRPCWKGIAPSARA